MPVEYEIRIDETSTSNITYIGFAAIGIANTNTAEWKIKRIEETTQTIIEWADGNNNFDNIWDDRVSLTYS